MLEFSGHVFEKFSISNFTKMRPVDTKFFHVDGRTDRHDEYNSRFSKFSERV